MGQESKELSLWHGTNTTPPKMVYEGEEGFDMRFAKDGARGVGNYFAIHSSYSANARYVHVQPDGKKGLFLAKVLIGDSAPNVDANRKMPPLKSAHQNIRFDSVTDSTQMYIVYSNAKAYPLYYI